MGISTRRTGSNGRRATDHVETTDCDQYLSREEDVVVNGIPVLAPGTFGSDGKEHRLGFLHVNPSGKVSLQ